MSIVTLYPLITSLGYYWYYNIVSPLRDENTPELSILELDNLFSYSLLYSRYTLLSKENIDVYFQFPDPSKSDYLTLLQDQYKGIFESLKSEGTTPCAENVLQIHNKTVSEEQRVDYFIKFIVNHFAPQFQPKIEQAKNIHERILENRQELMSDKEFKDYLARIGKIDKEMLIMKSPRFEMGPAMLPPLLFSKERNVAPQRQKQEKLTPATSTAPNIHDANKTESAHTKATPYQGALTSVITPLLKEGKLPAVTSLLEKMEKRTAERKRKI